MDIEYGIKEILRYSGCKKEDEAVLSLIDESIKECEGLIDFKYVYKRLPIEVKDDSIEFSFATYKSESLAQTLNGCEECFLICATIGPGIDRLIRKYGTIQPSKSLILQAIGTERIEAYLDKLGREWADELAVQGKVIKSRFSPGYGDLDIEMQKDIFLVLDTDKIGVKLSDSLLMSPSKSVTALIGIQDIFKGLNLSEECLEACEKCKKECSFRKV